MDSLSMIAAVTGSYLLAGLVKGVIGLGLPAVAIGLLGLSMPPAQAAAIIVMPALVTNIWQCAFGGNVAALISRLWPLLVGICIGTLLGAFFLPHGGTWATVCLGALLMIYATLGLAKIHFSVPRRAENWVGMLAGIGTGLLTAATGVSAIPTVPYLQALHFERDKLVQALGVSFTVSTIALAFALSHAGEMHVTLVEASFVGLIAALVGMRFGQFIRSRVTADTFRLYFFFGLLALGVRLALRGLI